MSAPCPPLPRPAVPQFPNPDLYFKVFDSERDEPETKYREDVNKLYARWEEKYGRKWPENGLNTEDIVWLYEEAYKDEKEAAEKMIATDGGRRPRGKKGGCVAAFACLSACLLVACLLVCLLACVGGWVGRGEGGRGPAARGAGV
jgi:hypothetical protein